MYAIRSYYALIYIVSTKGFSYISWIGTGIFILMLIYQHIIVKPDDISKVNIAFGTTNGIASVILSIFVIADLLFF